MGTPQKLSASRLVGLALLVVGMLALSGCYEELTPTQYQAGVYKGSPDPLTDKLADGALQGQLRERLQLAAQDR